MRWSYDLRWRPRDHRPYARAGLDGRLGRRHFLGWNRASDTVHVESHRAPIGCPVSGSLTQVE